MQLTVKLADKYFADYGTIITSFGFTEWVDILARLHRMKYFEAPASSKFHLSVPGGLYLHSVGVVERALKMRAGIPDLPPWKIILAGLLHDIGKCGTLYAEGVYPRYLPGKPGEPYSVNRPQLFTVRDLSAMYAREWGVPWDVVQAILLHDGLYCDQNKPYIDLYTNLSLLLTNADNLQAKVFETDTEAFLSLAEGSKSAPDKAGAGQGNGEAPGNGPKAQDGPGRP